MLLWLEFILCAAAIAVCGANLAKYGDVIAEKTGLGRAWTGLILMAGITSLPELATGISSVALADVPDIAVGDILGACVFNLLILALLDPMDKVSPIFVKVGQSHILSAGFGVVLLGITSVSIVLKDRIPSLAHIGAYSPLIVLAYIIGIRAVYFYEQKFIRKIVEETAEKLMYAHISTRSAVALYSLNGLVIIIVATLLPFIAFGIAESTGLGDSFVGTIFVSVTTTMPELVVSFSAMRMGAPDLALGNLLGSNMFNISLLAVDDIFYTKGPLLSHVSSAHAVTGVMAILMTAIVLISITYRPERKVSRLGWDSITMIAIGLFNIYILYKMRGD